jgi:hypothetical protein
VVRLEDDYWRIRSDKGELDLAEQQALQTYFDEIRLPYRLFQGRPCVSDVVPWEFIFGRLQRFYADRAEVYPF